MNSIETPSGKTYREENFPVGSWLLSKTLRPKILVFYNFARSADDIADNPDLKPSEKIKRLNMYKLALKNKKVSTYGEAVRIFESRIRKFTKSKHAFATINGTSALHLSLFVLGVDQNCEVLIPSLNFIAISSKVSRQSILKEGEMMLIDLIPFFGSSNNKSSV